MTPEEVKAKAEAVNKELSELKAQVSEAVNKEDLKAIEDSLKSFKTEKEADVKVVQELKEALVKQGETLEEMKNKGNDLPFSLAKEIKTFLSEKKDEIATIQKQGHGFVEFVSKAPESLTTGSAANVGTVPTQYGDMTGLNLNGTFIESLVSVSNTNSPNYPYTEVEPKDGDYAFVAEAAIKPQIDFKMSTRFATPAKIAAWEKLTMESIQDLPRMESLARELLLKKHNLYKQGAILTADETEIKGITTLGRAFVAGDMALKVENPTFLDVVNAAIVDIRNTHNYQDETPYQANVVLVNDVDYFIEVQSKKETHDSSKHLFSDAPLIGGVRVIPTPEIASGKILVCDASKYNVVNYMPYTVKVGWVNDDFIKNQFVILAESRFYGFVKRLDQQAFIYDDIATIKTAITAA